MGNSCNNGPSKGGQNAPSKGGQNGFFQSVSAAVWRPRQVPPPETASNKDSDKDSPISQGSSEDSSGKGGSPHHDSEAGAASQVHNTPPPHVKIVEDKPASKPSTTEVKDDGKNKNMKRMASAGLQVDSVLQKKTGNLKDFYSIGKKLGQGQFGTTFLCVEKKSKKEFACKSIAKRKLVTKEDVEDVRREIQIMHHVAGHPNVISIVAAYEDAVAVYVMMELCSGGELFDRIVQRGHYSERKAAELARVIVSVVESCHSLGVLHRDLKPENFLFSNEDEEAPLKAIDFGLSVFFKPGVLFYLILYLPIFYNLLSYLMH